MKPSGIGGQAVIEGVMMKNKDQYAIAVRKPNNEIVIEKNNYVSIGEKYKLFKLPIFRGMLAFVESMIIGSRTLTFSASFYEEEEDVKPSKMEQAFSKVFKDKAESIAMGITFLISILLAVGIFIILPRFVAKLLSEQITSEVVLTIIEGCFRIMIFIAYVTAIAQVKDIKRMFMYHGAEHKTINCLEHGFELTVENVKWQSKQHKRCGTSFMFIVMFVSIIFFIFIRVDFEWARYLIRILLIPIIAGISYEFIRLAGKSNSKLVNVLSQPGMWMQGLTTKEPDDEMIEVAIQSVGAVFDWREFLVQNDDKSKSNSGTDKKNISMKKRNKNNNQETVITNNNQEKTVQNSKQKNNQNSSQKNIQNNNQKNNQNKNQNNDQNSNQKNNLNSNQNNSQNKNQNNIKVNSDVKESGVLKTEKNTSGIQQEKTTTNKQSYKNDKKTKTETKVMGKKTPEVKPKVIYCAEEDDEILKALDRFLSDNEESNKE